MATNEKNKLGGLYFTYIFGVLEYFTYIFVV